MTHTFAELAVTAGTYEEIAEKLREANYGHTFIGDAIDMHGIGLIRAIDDGDSYPWPEHGWTCFHCGETFRTKASARDHFGADPGKEPGCIVKVKLGDERGILYMLRKAEEELDRYRAEDSDADRQMQSTLAGHAHELIRVEEGLL